MTSKVLFLAPIYNYYPILAASLKMQTHPDWELLLCHDGPPELDIPKMVAGLDEPRVRYMETDKRYNDYGHSLRQIMLERVRDEGIAGTHIVVTNADNYYVPYYCEYALSRFQPDTVGVYCDMVHSHRQWRMLPSKLARGYVDCGSIMVRRAEALAVPWERRDFAADWFWIEELVRRYGQRQFRHINHYLFFHN